MRRRKATADLEPLASLVQRLGVLFAAGVTPASGWAYVAEGARGSALPRARAVAAAAGRGESIAGALIRVAGTESADETAWRGLAAAWLVATDGGAPLAPTLAELASSLRSLAQNERDLQTALAAPVATARMVMLLPLVGILFGMALGFDSLGTLFTTAPGLICLGAGLTLMAGARLWNGRLVTGSRPTDLTPGLALDLMAIAVSGGGSLSRARRAVAEARQRCGIATDGTDGAIEEVLELSRRAGVPAAALLRSEAVEARRAARTAGERKAATLAVTLMFPLGLCILPAFMLLGVAPLVIAVISSTVAPF
jgi:tight adherence protein B